MNKHSKRCYKDCSDYACARAGECTGAGKWMDEDEHETAGADRPREAVSKKENSNE